MDQPVQSHVNARQYREIELDLLDIAEANVRQEQIRVDIEELAHSIATFGLQQPIVVEPNGNRFHIIIGQRRYLAAKELGWKTIPAMVLSHRLDDLNAKVVSFSENAQRRDLTPRDKSRVCRYLRDELGSTKAVADRLGISEQTVRKWLGYDAVPEPLKALVDAQRIRRSTATRLAASIPDEAKVMAIAERLADRDLTADERDRVLNAAEDYPDRSVDAILRRADEREVRKIVFILPGQWSTLMDSAARDLGKEPEDIARDATIEWLQQRRQSDL